jgi:AcrR family transcriptional regulator
MRRRAESVEATRLRIVEATVRLHTEIGLAATTVAGIADEAGVTRLTVYRHFPHADTLFAACSAHWLARTGPPDPSTWSAVVDPGERMRTGLADLYGFYRRGEAMLTHVHRDAAVLPAELRRGLEERDAGLRDLLLAPFAARGLRRRRLTAVLGHAVSFQTWRSLCVKQGLSDGDAVEAMTSLALATGGTSSA